MIPRQGALAGLGLRHRNAVPGGELRQHRAGIRIMHAAAGDDQRRLRRHQEPHGLGEFRLVRLRLADAMNGSGEKFQGEFAGFRLRVLAESQRHRAASGGIGQHLQGARQGREQLFGAGNPVEIAGDRPEAVIRRNRGVLKILDLLQHRIRPAGGEHIAGQQQHRQPVGMGQRRRRHHVQGARPDRGGAGHHPPAPLRLGISNRRMRHRLLVMRAEGRQTITHGIQRLPQSGHISMAEDRPYAAEQRVAAIIGGDALRREIAHQGLRRRQSDHGRSPGLMKQ